MTSIRTAVAGDAAALAAARAAADTTQASPPTREYFLELLHGHPGRVYLAEAGGSVAGYLALQDTPHAAVVARRPLRLWQLYVARAFHGRGVAAQLMSAAAEHARRHGHDVLWLGVDPRNARAIAFYRKHGFASLGLHEVGAADHAHQDLLMSRPVSEH